MKKAQRSAALLLCVALLAMLAAVPAAAAEYGAQGVGGQTLTMLAPSDIDVVSEDGYYLNRINKVRSNAEDIVFKFLFGHGMNNYSESLFTEVNLPRIGVYDSYGGTLLASPQFVSGSSAGISISVPVGTLADGTYYLVFGAAVQSNNADKVLGKDIVFEFTVGQSTGGGAHTPETPEEPEPGETTPPAELPYTDVAAWAVPHVAAVLENGCMTAASDTLFGASRTLTRGEFISIIGKARGINAGKWTVSAFSDVPADSVDSPYIAWAFDKGIVNGIGDGLFAPDQPLSREQALVILYRYAQAFNMDTTASASLGIFSDKGSVSSWAKEAVQWGVGSGFLSGNPDGTFLPRGTVSKVVTAKLVDLVVL